MVVSKASRIFGRRRFGFTLLEVLIAMGVSALLFWLLLAAINQFSRSARHASGGASAFDQARLAISEIRDTLEQATLNPYWAVSYNSAGYPYGYHRLSDLHFIGGPASQWFSANAPVSGYALFFQAPLGYEEGTLEPGTVLNALGYYVQWRDTREDAPASMRTTLPPRWRFQLRELRQSGDALGVMIPQTTSDQWIRDALTEATHLVAENVAWLVFRYHSPPGSGRLPTFQWDSRSWDNVSLQPAESHQMPPIVDIAVLVLDESIASRLAGNGGSFPVLPLEELFQNPGDFEDDLQTFEDRLTAIWPQNTFRLMRTKVAIRAAKWSVDPTAPSPTPPPEEEE